MEIKQIAEITGLSEETIKNLNVLELTPIEAINILYELKNKVK